jgi:hypothetical protein
MTADICTWLPDEEARSSPSGACHSAILACPLRRPCPLCCRIEPYLIKAAPLRSAAPGHARTGLRPWGADPARRAGHLASIHRSDRLIGNTDGRGEFGPSSSAYQCPSHGRRVKGAYGIAC